LGKGLGALIPTESRDDLEEPGGPGSQEGSADAVRARAVKELRLEEIRANPWQPRRELGGEGLEELAQSVKARGLLQPVIVRRADEGYELVAGERRLEACRMAGLDALPAIVVEATNREMLEMALIENLQREDLNPIDEARAYRRLREEFGLTQEEIAARVGKDRASVANQLRLLQLAPEVQEHVSRGTLSAGHGRALLGAREHGRQVELANLVLDKQLSVRETERLVQKKHRAKRVRRRQELSAELASLEECLREHLATKVSIKPSGTGGTIEIQYYDSAELERILEAMGAWRTPH